MFDILSFLKIVSIPLLIIEFLSILYLGVSIIISLFFTKDEESEEPIKVDHWIYLHTFLFSIFLALILI